MPLPRRRSLLLLLPLLAAAPLAAQLPPLTVPKGLLRLDLTGRFENWDKAFFGGVKQDAAGDFIRNPADQTWLPELATTAERLRSVTGVDAPSLSLGKTSANMLVNIGTENIGAAYGLTRRLTLFGNVPIVRVRVQDVFSLDSTGATAGFNPAHPEFGTPEGADTASRFFIQLHGALLSLNIQIQAGAYDNDPAKKALALATLAEGTAFESSLQALLNTSTFLPLAGTPAAAALSTSLNAFRSKLLAVDIPGFTNSPAFPKNGIPAADFADFATSASGSIAAQPFEPPILRYIGDIELGAAFELLDRRRASSRLTVHSVLQGTVRLRTGKLDQPDALFDLGTGDRQPDVQGDLVTDLGWGKLGARVTARYVLQLPGRQTRRLSPADQPFAPAASLAAVERDPGEIVEGVLEPWLRIAPNFAVVAGIRHWSKGVDKYRYAPGQDSIPGTTPDVLALGSKENGTAVSAALSFVHSGVRRDGKTGIPIDATVRVEWVTGSSLGRVPARETVSLALRLYRKMF